MRYAGLIKNDMSAAPGVCVTLFVQGCPIHCKGCHNPEAWDFNGGKKFTYDTIKEIISAICANGLQRDFCLMGGEPLCEENVGYTDLIVEEVKKVYPSSKVYIWSGYTYDELTNRYRDRNLQNIKNNADYLIVGPYIEEERDVTLKMRGSKNQKIIALNGNQEIKEI